MAVLSLYVHGWLTSPVLAVLSLYCKVYWITLDSLKDNLTLHGIFWVMMALWHRGLIQLMEVNYPDSKCSWGQGGANLGPTGPRWAPCWPHELCYLGSNLSLLYVTGIPHDSRITEGCRMGAHWKDGFGNRISKGGVIWHFKKVFIKLLFR